MHGSAVFTFITQMNQRQVKKNVWEMGLCSFYSRVVHVDNNSINYRDALGV